MSSGVGDDGSDVFRFEMLRGKKKKKKKKKKQSCVLDRSAKRKRKRRRRVVECSGLKPWNGRE